MINIKNSIIIVSIITFIICVFCNQVNASSVNMNLTQTNTSSSTSTYNTNSSSQNNVSRTNTTAIQSVNSINEVSSSGFGVNEILSIFLIAIGFVLILLAVAILIRLK